MSLLCWLWDFCQPWRTSASDAISLLICLLRRPIRWLLSPRPGQGPFSPFTSFCLCPCPWRPLRVLLRVPLATHIRCFHTVSLTGPPPNLRPPSLEARGVGLDGRHDEAGGQVA